MPHINQRPVWVREDEPTIDLSSMKVWLKIKRLRNARVVSAQAALLSQRQTVQKNQARLEQAVDVHERTQEQVGLARQALYQDVLGKKMIRADFSRMALSEKQLKQTLQDARDCVAEQQSAVAQAQTQLQTCQQLLQRRTRAHEKILRLLDTLQESS